MRPRQTPPRPRPEALVSVTDAAHRFGVSEKTIRRRIADGTLTAYRFPPRLIRVDLAEAEKLLRPVGGAA
jgi:excisionase family DNA binding protein